MKTTTTKTAAEERLAEQFGALSVSDSGTINQLRKTAFESFEGVGLPHRRVEAYKYTDLRRSLTDVPPIAGDAVGDIDATPSPEGAVQIAVTNGRLGAIDGLPEGVTVTTLRDKMSSGDLSELMSDGSSVRLAAGDPLVQLNTAFMGDGAVIHVAANTDVTTPIDLVHRLSANAPATSYVRHIVVVEAGAKVTLMESHLGTDVAHLSNTVIEIKVGEGAQVALIRRQESAADDRAFSTALVDLGADANLQYFTLNAGSALSRGQIFLSFLGERAHADLLGTTLCGDQQLLDTTLFVDHATPHCTSTEVFKSVIADEGQSVFQGKIIVRPHAQKTDAQMMSRSLLLSETAEAINKPELEIYADDVQCAHGATVGALDEDMLFYLLSRGIARPEAERLLVQSFLAEPIEMVSHGAVQDFLLERLIAQLQG